MEREKVKRCDPHRRIYPDFDDLRFYRVGQLRHKVYYRKPTSSFACTCGWMVWFLPSQLSAALDYVYLHLVEAKCLPSHKRQDYIAWWEL